MQTLEHAAALDLGARSFQHGAALIHDQVAVGDALAKARFCSTTMKAVRQARVAEPLQSALADLLDLDVEILPKMSARQASADTFQRGRRSLDWPAGDDAAEQRTRRNRRAAGA